MATKFTTITSLSSTIHTRIVDDIREVGNQDELLEFVEACRVLPPVPEATTTGHEPTVSFDLNSALPARTDKHHRMKAISNSFYTQLMTTQEADGTTTMTTDLELKLRSAVAIFTSPTKPIPPVVDLTQTEPVPPPDQVLPPNPVPPPQ